MRKKYLIYIVIIIIGFGLRAFSQQETTPPQILEDTKPKENTQQYLVTQVIDGDTIKINKDGNEETLRLLGIDTPEVDPTYNAIECFGQEASKETRTKLLGQSIRLEDDPSQAVRDKYNRLLVYVFTTDGTNFNQYLIEKGFAKEYTYAGSYNYQKEFKAAEEKAHTEARGLWSSNNCPQ